MEIDADNPPPLFKQFGRDEFLKHWRLPHGDLLGLELIRLAHSRAVFRAPWREDVVGDPATGVIHGGLVTTLLDSACGMAVFCAAEDLAMFATLDLRIDYMRPAKPGKALIGDARCTKFGRTIAFVEAVAYEAVPEDPVGTAHGAFMSLGRVESGAGQDKGGS